MKKNRAEIEKKRLLKEQRKKEIDDLNEKVMILIKKLKDCTTEEETNHIKKFISQVKGDLKAKCKERDLEEKKEWGLDATPQLPLSKTNSYSKFPKEKIKKKVITKNTFELELGLTDESLIKERKLIYEKLKSITTDISDYRPTAKNTVKVKLFHSDEVKLKNDIEALNCFEILLIKETKEEKQKSFKAGYYRRKGY